jgi:hypothetical protein
VEGRAGAVRRVRASARVVRDAKKAASAGEGVGA